MRISVIIATYKRPIYLEKCLNSIFAQEKKPDEIVIISRNSDSESHQLIKRIMKEQKNAVWKEVDKPGIIYALNEAANLAGGDILCFIDDDAVAYPDWLKKIESFFLKYENVGVLGGKEIIPDYVLKKNNHIPGKLSWYGKIIGGTKPFSSDLTGKTDVVKGCNMCIRKGAIAQFDENIGGYGQSYEIDVCFNAKKKGFMVFYDGNIAVEHYYAPRERSRDSFDYDEVYYYHYNTSYVMIKHLRWFKLISFIIYFFVGDFLFQALRFLKHGRFKTVIPMIRGKIEGVSRVVMLNPDVASG